MLEETKTVSSILVKGEGNVLFIITRVVQALREVNISQTEIEKYREEATSGDYHNLLRISVRWLEKAGYK